MDFDFTTAQRVRSEGILAAVRDRLGSDDPPAGYFTRQQWKQAAEIGLTGLCLPREQGGGGLGALDTALCLEAFGRGCPDTGLVFAVSAHLFACAVAIRDFAGDAVRAGWLTGMAAGDLIGANAMTEAGAGSDVGSLSVRAEPDGAGYLLNGEKTFVSNGPAADLFVTYAVTDPQAGFLGISGFVVPRHFPGVVVGEPMPKMGLASCPAARVRFEDCRVPASHRLGNEGSGSAIFQHSMSWERCCLFAGYLGLMERQLEQCITRASKRQQFGRAIAEFQAISHRVAVMRQRLESARLLLYRACWMHDQKRDNVEAVAMAKVAVSEAAVANSIDAVQIFGGAGYLAADGIERQLRDCMPATIFSGTNEIQRELIARAAGL